ncbi:MAG: HipA domain-containing protein [Desulfuromonas sp.]|nr:HipA domain-containing protein [Desulfuromonas sp.]
MGQALDIEIYHNGEWQKAATFSVHGVTGTHFENGTLEYDIDYVVKHMDCDNANHRVAVNYPVNFALYTERGWPAFLLDILPAGSAREYWLERLNLKDNDSAHWPLLQCAAGNAPGNIRIASAARFLEEMKGEVAHHPGFERKDILKNKTAFLNYAESCGAYIGGGCSAQGQAPKFLLVEDWHGRWHVDGALPDSQIKKHWLVKFPHEKRKEYSAILRNEAAYYEVARQFGLQTGNPLIYEDDVLFVERFDRTVDVHERANVKRHGLESIASLCGLNDFGGRKAHDDICERLAQCVDDPKTTLQEYLKRDFLNIAMGNVDNHCRNTAIIKYETGETALSLLYDFAPMFLSPEGIARATRWINERPTGMPGWAEIAVQLELLVGESFHDLLYEMVDKIERLPETMKECGVEPEIISRRIAHIHELGHSLQEARRALNNSFGLR